MRGLFLLVIDSKAGELELGLNNSLVNPTLICEKPLRVDNHHIVKLPLEILSQTNSSLEWLEKKTEDECIIKIIVTVDTMDTVDKV